MSDVLVGDRKATYAEVRAHASVVRRLAKRLGITVVHVRDDGAVVIHSGDPGYRTATRLSAAASEVVGTYVHVITDDVPGAVTVHEL